MSGAAITFLGAAGEVTGSCSLVRCGGQNVLVDCGMFQGGDEDQDKNRAAFPFDPATLSAVVLTHGHLDHSGRLPSLVAAGFKGPIVAHAASGELAEIVWRDSARLSEKWDGGPLYDEATVERTVQQLKPVRYAQPWTLGELTVRFHDAGHILGSSHVVLQGGGQRLLFSGDIGMPNTPILRDPTIDWDFEKVDAVVVESTYGNREHKGRAETVTEFERIVRRAVERRAMVIVPAFAIGRTQELLFHLRAAFHEGRLPEVPVLLDSPMAERVTDIYRKHRECYDEQTWGLIESGQFPMRFPSLRELVTADQSKTVRRMAPPAVVIAGSGMCTGGRVMHHLKDFLPRESTTVVFVGWQGAGTLGRRLVDGAERVRIHGQEFEVHARIATLNGFSAHADRAALVAWSRHLPAEPGAWFVNHGEPEAVAGLVAALRVDGRQGVRAAEAGGTVEIG